MKDKTLDEDVKRSSLTFFILFFPSLLVAIVGFTIDVWLNQLVMTILILLWQVIVLKNFIDTSLGG